MLVLTALMLGAVEHFPIIAQDAPTPRVIEIASGAPNARLSPDGAVLAVYPEAIIYDFAPQARYLWLVDATTGEEIAALTGMTDYASAVAFSADGARLVSAHYNGDLFIWDVAGATLEQTVPFTFLGGARFVDFTPDGGQIVVMAGDPAQFFFIDLDAGVITRVLSPRVATRQAFVDSFSDPFMRLSYALVAADLSPDGATLAVANANNAVYLWEVATGDQRYLRLEAENKGRFEITAVSYAATGALLAYSDTELSVVSLRDAENGAERASLPIRADVLALSPDGAQLAWITRETGVLRLGTIEALQADIEGAETLLTLAEGPRIVPRTTRLEFSDDGQTLALSGLFITDADTAPIYLFDLGE
jgi:WD40 repeat protein